MKSLARFGALLSLVYAALGVLVRLRVIAAAPLPLHQPLRWLLAGAAGDLVVAVAAAAAAALACALVPRLGAALLTLFLTTVLLTQFALAEAFVFFGHGPRGEDLETGLHPRLLIGSAGGGVLASALVLVTIFIACAAWSYRRRDATRMTLTKLAAAALVVWVASALAKPDQAGDAARNALLAIPSLLRNARVGRPAGAVPRPALDARAVRELAGARHGRWLADSYPLAALPPPRSPSAISLPPGTKPNIVVLALESLRVEEVGAYGGEPPGVTPNLDALARDGIRFDRVYSAGSITPEGELGLLYGALPSPWGVVIRARPNVKLTGLPDILASHGWQPLLWMHSSDATLYLGESFYRERNVRVIDGRDFPQSDPATSWGLSDRALMRHAIEAIDRIPQPFATFVLTISNHHPYALPPDAASPLPLDRSLAGELLGKHTSAMLQTIHYTDAAVGEFFRAARAKPWFANTIFVICGDHGVAVAPLRRAMTRHVFYELRHRVAMIFYSPLLPRGIAVPGPSSQTDVLPTLLGLAGLRVPISTTGHDLLDPAQRDEARPVVSWDLFTRTVTVQRGRYSYHAALANGRLANELLVDVERDPQGTRDLMSAEPSVAAACRRAASIYLDVYGWLIANDRMTVP